MADSVTEQAAKTEYIMTPIRPCLNQNIPTEEPCTLFPPNACVGVKNNANNHQKPRHLLWCLNQKMLFLWWL